MNVAVVCRAKSFAETRRKQGWWSYPVPDLEWTCYPVQDGERLTRADFERQGHDLVVWEDWCWPIWEGRSGIPIYAVVVDSNTSSRRRKLYLERAKAADVLLIDQDRLDVFGKLGKPVFRWQYAVNEQVFAPSQKQIDVAYHVARTDERAALAEPLAAFCREREYSLTMGGGMTIDQYAARLAAARICVHKATWPQCRSHRFFDALAAGCCLLTDPVQPVAEDGFIPGRHFMEWDGLADLTRQVALLLDSGQWNVIAQAGQGWVLRHHTWRTRASELMTIIERTYAAH